MADLAVGLSKKVVDRLAKKVEDAIKEEKELWQIVERDSVFIKGEFEMMTSFLKTADRDRVRNNVVRTWVRQVRDLSYDAEDCIDGVLELEPKWALSFLPRVLPTWCRPKARVGGRALDEAVDKIKLMKARVEEVSNRNLRYNLINTTGSGQMQQAATAMDMDLDLAKVPEGSLRLRVLLDYEARHGRLSVISVWGTGGNLGTVSIIRNAFENPLVCKVNKCRAWVKLMHPFSPQKFLGDLVAQLHADSGGADVLSKMEASPVPVDPAKEVERLLKGHSYLIVLEDLSNMEEWYTIRTYLPVDENASHQQVIVSTQDRRVARLCIGQPQYVQELSQLSADDCVYAFFEEVRIPSEQDQGSMDIASLTAAANYWYCTHLTHRDEEVCQLSDLIFSSGRRAPDDAHVVTVLGPKIAAKEVVAKVCSQWVLNYWYIPHCRTIEERAWLQLHFDRFAPSFELYGWVNVPNSPFSVWGFSQSLLSFLCPNSPCYFTNPVEECSRLLSQHRCLVVINGLQRTEDCSALASAGLIYKHPNSCIVVVTTNNSVSTYWTAGVAVCRIEPIAHEQDGLVLPSTAVGSTVELQDFADYWYHCCLTGRDEEQSQLHDMISSSRDQQNNVLTVWGPRGVGKSSLVAKVYSHYVLSTADPQPFQLYGWVDVSSNSNLEISLEGFSQTLLSYMQRQLHGKEKITGRGPVQKCLKLLTSYCCLLVIDGLQSMEDCWKLIDAGLIYGHHPNSCIILITADERVPRFWSSHAVCKIKRLDVQQQQQDRLYTAGCTMAMDGPSSELQYYYWNNYCLTELDEELSRLHNMISSSSSRNGGTRVLTVWGPHAVGKTSLVAKVYSHYCLSIADPPPFQLYGWVNVYMRPLSSLEGFVSQSLLSHMRTKSTRAPVPLGTDDTPTDPIQDCINLLAKNRCLVVIEGLQSVKDCHSLINAGLIYGHPNSCIILITEEESVATYWKEKTPHAVCKVKPPNVQHQGELTTPGSMVDGMTRLFNMANRRFLKYYSIVGRDAEVGRISSIITSSSTGLVVVCGPPGVGKTALVEKVYSQFMLHDSSFALYGWVQVPNPFTLIGFSRSLLKVMRPQSPQSPDPIGDCSNLVQNYACLVVIDGLQSMENFWELVNARLIYGHPCSCILLITTEKSVTTCMASLIPAHALLQVKPLDRKSAGELFTQVYERERPNSVIIDSDLVVDKCSGLPILIFSVAEYLSRVSDDQVRQLTAVVKDGKFIHELATNPHAEFVRVKGLLAWMDSYLKACSQSLKLLIFYMLNFSKGKVIRRKRLMRRWIAEGFINNTGICDMVTEAEKSVRELEELKMMMIQVPPSGRKWNHSFQLSGFCSEVLMSRQVEDPLFLPLEVSALMEGKRGLTSGGCAGRHLRVDDKWERSESVFCSLDLSLIRSLTVSGKFEAFFLNGGMKVLRVLDLEDATGVENEDLEKISKLLPRLRFLSLRGCSRIFRLPDSIGDLRQLQTWDIRGTGIQIFPDSILKLRNLQCLRAGDTMKAMMFGDPCIPERRRSISSRLRGLAPCSLQTQTHTQCDYARQGVIMPIGMGSQLTALHTLGIVNVNTAGGEATLEELQHLHQLRKLELYGINSYNVEGLRHLRLRCLSMDSLSLGFTKEDVDASSGFWGCLSNLQSKRLKVYGHVGILKVLPSDMKVTDLTLEVTASLTEDNMRRIREVSCCPEQGSVLRTLRLHFHTRQEGGKLEFGANNGDFPLLRVLEISSLDESLEVEFASGTMMNSLVELKCVGSLKIPLGGLDALPSLREVWVGELPVQEAQSLKQVLQGHPNKPARINYSSWRFMRG